MSEITLLQIWQTALQTVSPGSLLPGLGPRGRFHGAATLFWGKSAVSSYEALRPRLGAGMPFLVISPAQAGRVRGLEAGNWFQGEHPFPGPGSFRAGEALLDFLDAVGRFGCSRLEVFLSGGASSLAWVRPAGLSEAELERRLRALYARPLAIGELNRERARLCVLKGGGAARWLGRLAPGARARVNVISDVLPYGSEVVGSGPFWSEHIPHRVLADNRALVVAASRAVRGGGEAVLGAEWGRIGEWQGWARRLSAASHSAIAAGRAGVFVWGGEPAVALPASALRRRAQARGGRQTQLAAALALELGAELRAGRVEFLCAGSDGSDGFSDAAGAWVRRAVGETVLRDSLRHFNSADVLARAGALIPRVSTGTNVQDLVLLRVR